MTISKGNYIALGSSNSTTASGKKVEKLFTAIYGLVEYGAPMESGFATLL